MSKNIPEKSGTESDQTQEQHAHVNKAHHDATPLSPGPPALYRLNTERKHVDGTDRKVRQWTYKRRDKQNKVILLVGESGTGKTTIINTMINYLLGVKFEDQVFYQITEEENHPDQSQPQTPEITVYEAFVEENPTALTIIDTPGYGHTEGFEKEKEISENLTRLFSEKDGIRYIDAVCFVMKASQDRLSEKQHYIFHSFLSLFGKDIKNNIVFLLTQSDGGRPTEALNAIKKAGIPCGRDEDKEPVHFLFNNRQKEERDKRYNHGLKSAWRLGEESMNEFFTVLEEKNRKSVQMTLDVLKERRRFGACVSNLKDRINENEAKIQELTKIQELLRQNRDEVEKGGVAVAIRVKRGFKEKVPIVNESWKNSEATCCSVCEENCHEWKCYMAPNPSWCEVMKNSHCTVCTGKCHYSKHIRENKKYVLKEKDVIINHYEGLEEELKRDLEKLKEEKSLLLQEAYNTIMSLSEIALKVDSAFTLRHLDYLIPRLKEDGKDEWVKILEDLKKAGEEQRNKGL